MSLWWVIALAAVALVAVYLLLSRGARGEPYWPEPVAVDATAGKPVPFGYKIQWLAVRGNEPEEVVEKFRGHLLANGFDDIEVTVETRVNG